MPKKITWTNSTRKLSELIPWDENPRTIREDQAARLTQSIAEFSQIETIAIGPDNEIYNGHQRLKSWRAEFGDLDIDVRVASRKLSKAEKRKLTIYLHHTATGETNWDALANWDPEELIDWGMDEKLLEQFNRDAANLNALLSSEQDYTEDDQPIDKYTDRLVSPIYEPTGERPNIHDLADKEKYQTLIKQIDESTLDEEIKQFFSLAATRHIAYRYDKIAEYYAHASREEQQLMEASALVIIDFNQAIEQGFVHMTDQLKQLFLNNPITDE